MLLAHWSDNLMLTGPKVQGLTDTLGTWARHMFTEAWDQTLQKYKGLFTQ